ncbi:winged helix-turn-helix domain-containing protein [Natrialba chahannaoensis]|nr:winged helix-turn-helix domain-containing protein [Natrialba chahannaoensis]
MTKAAPMRLSLPSDQLVLQQLTEGRNTAANIAAEVDRSRNYINQRMPQLYDYGLVIKVGPVEGTGLYEITPKGVATLRLIDDYEEGSEFENRVEDRAELIEVGPPEIIDRGAGQS